MFQLSRPASQPTLPIVVFGGFLSQPQLYTRMRDWLAQRTGQQAWVVDTRTHDWLMSVTAEGWAHLLDKLRQTVHRAVESSDTGKITLIGHSSGGVMARLFLSPAPFQGRTYHGLEYVAHLITLGSPHKNRHGTRMRKWVEKEYPGSFFPSVRYTSVAGKARRGNLRGSLRERWAYFAYRELCGDGTVWGDGLVPISSQLLDGSQQIVLEGVGHFAGFSALWYGSVPIISRWWTACMGEEERSNSE